MTPALLSECTASTFAGTTPFPEVVARLTADGVEWYSANLIFGVTTHYAPDGSHHQSSWPPGHHHAIANDFHSDQVIAAIRASQQGHIIYPTFLQLIAAAGVTYYTVHLQGRKAIYFGRHGDFHIEHFPAAPDPTAQ